MNIGQELRQRRIMARLTLQQAADLHIVSAATVSRVENGKVGIQAEDYFKWLDVYQNVVKVASFTLDRGQEAVSRR